MWGAPASWRHELWQAHCAWHPFKSECHHNHANWLGLSDPAWVGFCAKYPRADNNSVCGRVRALQRAQPGLKAFMSKAAADTAAVAAAAAKADGSSRKTAYDDDDPAAPAHQR